MTTLKQGQRNDLTMSKKLAKLRLPLTTVVLGLLVAGLGITAWFVRPQQVMSKASQSLEGSESVKTSKFELGNVGGFLLKPVSGRKDVSVIFYPGARVPAQAYAPVALEIAEEGYEIFLVNAPLNLAVLGWKKAGKIIDSRNETRIWVMAGHSMGGAMAARFASKADYPVSGLVLWAAYPPEGTKFSPGFRVLSITGEEDKIISQKKLERSKRQFPESAEFVEIEGANHSQFGWYGFQSGDGEATISRIRQTELVAQRTTEFLNEF